MSLTKTALIIGGSGFVGSHLAASLRENYKVYATYHSHQISMRGVTFLPLSLEDKAWTKRLIRWIEPQIIIYCAGHQNKEWVETHPQEAELQHVSGIANVAEACGILQSKVLYLSNPYIFEGKRGNYHESDSALPVVSFGKLKLAGENALRSKSLNWAIIRSSPLYGIGIPFHPSSLDLLRMKLDRGMNVQASQWESHSYAPISGLIEMINLALNSMIKNRTLHYSGLTKVSEYDFTRQFARAFNYQENLIHPKENTIPMKEDFSLNCSYAIEQLKFTPLELAEGFEQLKTRTT